MLQLRPKLNRMEITKDIVVSIHYTLKDDDKNVLDTSEGREPLTYVHGYGYLIAGLEQELNGKQAGDKLEALVKPEDGYGLRDDTLVHKVPKSNFQGDGSPETGMQVKVATNDGPKIAVVTAVMENEVILDLNHPLSGKNLNFSVHVIGTRPATPEEIERGQAEETASQEQ